MLYEFTYPDMMCGHLINELEMRAEISGFVEDWSVDKIEFCALEPGKRTEDRWIEVPREHPRYAEFIRHLTTVEVHGLVTDAYAEHVIERIDDNYYRSKDHGQDTRVVDANDEHRLRKWEVM